MFGTGPLDYLYHIFLNYYCFVVGITANLNLDKLPLRTIFGQHTYWQQSVA